MGEERDEAKKSIETAQEWICNCKKIYFLGFSYGEENLEILDTGKSLNSEHRIWGTALGFLKEEIEKNKIKNMPRS